MAERDAGHASIHPASRSPAHTSTGPNTRKQLPPPILPETPTAHHIVDRAVTGGLDHRLLRRSTADARTGRRRRPNTINHWRFIVLPKLRFALAGLIVTAPAWAPTVAHASVIWG